MISFIIPMFNASSSICKCLDSILNCQYLEIEIIVVDDGSTDNCVQIVEKYCKKKLLNNIQILKKTNGGSSSARNYGLKFAKGDYIFFIDSDDFLLTNVFEKSVMSCINNSSPDLIFFDYIMFFSKTDKRYIKNYSSEIDSINNNYILHSTAPWLMLIKKELIDRLEFQFPQNIIFEDYACLPFLGTETNNIIYINEAVYAYNQSGNSVTRSEKNMFKEKYLQIIDATEYLLHLTKDNKQYLECIEFLVIRELLIHGMIRIYNCQDNKKFLIKKQEIIIKYFKSKYPHWKKNKFYKNSNFMYKFLVFCCIKNKLQLYYKIISLKKHLRRRDKFL